MRSGLRGACLVLACPRIPIHPMVGRAVSFSEMEKLPVRSRNMNSMLSFTQLMAIALCWTSSARCDPKENGEIDSSSDLAGDVPKLPEPELIMAGGIEVEPIKKWNPQRVADDELPKLETPSEFKELVYEAPTAVWRVDGGFLGAFNYGEFGGALFFAKRDSVKWVKILDGHISHLKRFEGERYLAVGGIAHLGLTEGRAFLLSRNDSGKWTSRKVYETQVGVPQILGTAVVKSITAAESEKLIVIEMAFSPWSWDPLFGISRSGAVHFLGEREKLKGIDHGSAGLITIPLEWKQENEPEPE